MTSETIKSTSSENEVSKNKLNYLWLNGERVTGIEGLQLFEDCRQMVQLPEISKGQIEELNSIISAALEEYTEESICSNWSSLVATIKDYFSEQGYCVIKQDKVSVEFRKPVESNFQTALSKKLFAGNGLLTAADLWNIHKQRRVRFQRKFL